MRKEITAKQGFLSFDDSATIEVTGPRGTINVTSQAKFNPVNFNSISLDIRYLDLAFDLLILGDA